MRKAARWFSVLFMVPILFPTFVLMGALNGVEKYVRFVLLGR